MPEAMKVEIEASCSRREIEIPVAASVIRHHATWHVGKWMPSSRLPDNSRSPKHVTVEHAVFIKITDNHQHYILGMRRTPLGLPEPVGNSEPRIWRS